MSREQNDSDGSWTWVDNEEENFKKRAEKRRTSSYERAEVEDIQPTDESDVSVLTDPEDHPGAADVVAEGTPLGTDELEAAKAHFKEMAAAMQTAAAVKAALDVAKPGESELAVTERRARAYFRSTFTSAGFMIGGLLIAAYCQWGCDTNYTSPVQEYYAHPYEGRDIDIIDEGYRGGKYRKHQDSKRDELKYAAHAHKNAREKYEEKHTQGKKRQKDLTDYHDEHKDFKKKQKKGDYKHKKEHHDFDKPEYKKKGKHDDDKDKENRPKDKKHKKTNQETHEKHNKPEKHNKHDKDKDHKDYLNKKEAYLKQKEGKLKQKEFKLYAKDASSEKFEKKYKKPKHDKYNKHNETSGEWYDNLHKGRKDKRRQEEQADWMFERAQGRDKKRDKAHWYFDMMDERETNRVKKH